MNNFGLRGDARYAPYRVRDQRSRIAFVGRGQYFHRIPLEGEKKIKEDERSYLRGAGGGGRQYSTSFEEKGQVLE